MRCSPSSSSCSSSASPSSTAPRRTRWPPSPMTCVPPPDELLPARPENAGGPGQRCRPDGRRHDVGPRRATAALGAGAGRLDGAHHAGGPRVLVAGGPGRPQAAAHPVPRESADDRRFAVRRPRPPLTITLLIQDDHLDPALSGSCGLPSVDMAVRLIDEAGSVVPTGAIGEVQVRSPTQMAGYYGADELD